MSPWNGARDRRDRAQEENKDRVRRNVDRLSSKASSTYGEARSQSTIGKLAWERHAARTDPLCDISSILDHFN